MTKYLLYNSRLVKPEMEKPEMDKDWLSPLEYSDEFDKYNAHLESLWPDGIECSAELLAKFKDGDWLEEGKDFELDTMAWQYGRVSVSTAEIAVPVQSEGAKDNRIKELEEALRNLMDTLPADGNNIYLLGFSKAVREAEKLLNPKKQSTP